ncbi:hypothetical protein HYX12_04395 [Candidatus Woesearchaeota archaeon]|nr:hypothetical protein [Candidatus Woesearchaeota archaeon]
MNYSTLTFLAAHLLAQSGPSVHPVDQTDLYLNQAAGIHLDVAVHPDNYGNYHIHQVDDQEGFQKAVAQMRSEADTNKDGQVTAEEARSQLEKLLSAPQKRDVSKLVELVKEKGKFSMGFYNLESGSIAMSKYEMAFQVEGKTWKVSYCDFGAEVPNPGVPDDKINHYDSLGIALEGQAYEMLLVDIGLDGTVDQGIFFGHTLSTKDRLMVAGAQRRMEMVLEEFAKTAGEKK